MNIRGVIRKSHCFFIIYLAKIKVTFNLREMLTNALETL